MILLTLSRGKGEETVRLQLPASPAEIGETFAFLDRISLDTTATAILDVSSNVPVLYRCLYDVDVEDSEQFQKLQKLAERTEALSPAKAAIFSGALDAECVWNLEGALTVADRLDEYMLVNNVSSDSELGIYLVNKGITPFPDRFKPYINYARVGAEYREKHGGEYSSGNYVQKKTPELLENERLDGVFRIWMENPCPVRVQSETAQITLPATFEQLESARQLLGVDSLNMAKLTRVEALRPYLGEYLPLQGMDLRLEQLDELAENIRIMDQEDGALLKYLSVLEVEQPATLQEALRFSIELDDYERVPDDPEEYGKQVLERIGADEELISSRLLGIDSIDEYIRYGGTLRAGELAFDDEDVNAQDASFRDDESTRRYIDTAICKNIQHSLACYESGGHFRHLYSLYEAGELTSAINRIIEDMNHRFLISVLTDDFLSHDLRLTAANLRKERDPEKRTEALDAIDTEAVTQRLMELLDIRNKEEQSIGTQNRRRKA